MPKPETNEQHITPLGSINFRSQRQKFGIKIDDRRRHVYVIGKTGVGKTTLLKTMAIADIRSGKGMAIVDPHGEFAEELLDFIPEERLDDVIYFNPADMDYPIAFNPMEQVGTEFRHLVASGMMGIFRKIFVDVWSARMAYILNNTLLALLELPGANILGIMRMLSEPDYRKKIVANVQDPVVKAFWVNEFAKYTQRLESEAVASIQNKVGQFVSNPLIRNILGQGHSTLNMREIMDTGKILIVNLSKGKIGEDNSALLGAMIITRLQLAAMSRVDIPEEKRHDFFLYVDEFQNFATDSFANILSEARKYRLSLVLAHQYIGQLVTSDGNTKVRDAVFGNVGTIVTFRVGAADAEFLEKEFMPEFLQNDLVNLAKANVYIKLMIDGVASRPFSAETLAPQKPPLLSYKDVIVENSQKRFGTPRKSVEAKIAGEWQAAEKDLLEERIERRGEARLNQTLRPPGEAPRGPRMNRSFSGRGNGFHSSVPPQYPRQTEPYPEERRQRQGYAERPQSGDGYHPLRRSSDRMAHGTPPERRGPADPEALSQKFPRQEHVPPPRPKPGINIDDLKAAIAKSLGVDKKPEESATAPPMPDSGTEAPKRRRLPDGYPEDLPPEESKLANLFEEKLYATDEEAQEELDKMGEGKEKEPETISLESLREKEAGDEEWEEATESDYGDEGGEEPPSDGDVTGDPKHDLEEQN